MANIFSYVKDYITTRDAAIHYGFKPNRSGLIVCPFHSDKNPSMKVDERFFCFGCGATGDVIDFVSMYFGLPIKSAAQKIANDFGLLTEEESRMFDKRNHINPSNTAYAKKVMPLTKAENDSFPEKEIVKAFRTVADYVNILREWKERYAPKTMNEQWDECFAEALVNLTKSEYLEDGLLFGSREERKEFYEQSRKEVERIGKRVADIESRADKRKPVC